MTNPDELVAQLGLYAGAFVVGALSSVVPFVVVDVFLMGVALHEGASVALVAIVLLASLGQLAGKLPQYYAVRGAAALANKPSPRLEWLRLRTARFRRHPRLVLTASALVGLPPFTILAAGASLLGIQLRAFAAIVFGGRAVRFAVVVLATLLFR